MFDGIKSAFSDLKDAVSDGKSFNLSRKRGQEMADSKRSVEFQQRPGQTISTRAQYGLTEKPQGAVYGKKMPPAPPRV